MTRRPSPRHIAAAIIVPLALLIALLAWGVSSPPGSSPDEDYHMASIWCAGGDVEGRCELTDREESRRLPADLVSAADCFKFNPGQAASCPLAEGEMASTERGDWVDRGYPPVFFAVMSTLVREDLSVSIVLMRSFNALLYVGVLTALFFLLPRRMRPILVWGSLITIVPLGMFLIPSVNPSAWAVLQATGLWLAVWGYYQQAGPKRIGLAAVSTVLMLIGAGARSDAAVYGVLALVVAAVLSFRRTRRFALDSILPVVLAVLAVVLFFSGGQSGVVTSETEPSGDVLGLLWTNLQLLPQLWVGAFGLWGMGGLGWLDTPMPGLVWITATCLFAAMVFWGLRLGDGRKWLSMLGVGSALVAIPTYILVREGIVVGVNVQPRYIYPLLIILGGLALVTLAGPHVGLARLQLVVVAAGLTVANSVALHVNLRRYITGIDGTGVNLDRAMEWWWNSPISPMGVWAAGSVAFAAAAAVLVWLAWGSDRRRGAFPAELTTALPAAVRDKHFESALD